MRKLSLVVCALSLLTCLAWPGFARAFFPDPEEVRRGMDKHAVATQVHRVDQTFTGVREYLVQEQGRQAGWTRLVLHGTGTSRTVVSASLGRDTEVVAAYPGMTSSPVSLSFLWSRSLAWWEERGLDVSSMNFGFADGRGCLVLGRDGSPVQLWVSADDFVPVRLVLSGVNGIREITWGEIRRVGNLSLPHAVLVRDGFGQEVSGTIKWQQVGGNLPGGEFSLSGFQAAYQGVRSTPHSLVGRVFPDLFPGPSDLP